MEKEPSVPVVSDVKDDEDLNDSKKDDDTYFTTVSNEGTTVITKLIWAMKNLETSYSPREANIIEEVVKKANGFKAGMDVEDVAMQTFTDLNLKIDEPKTFVMHQIIK